MPTSRTCVRRGREVRTRLLAAQREAAEAQTSINTVKARLQSFLDEKARLAREEQVTLEERNQSADSRSRLEQDLVNLQTEEASLSEIVAELGGEREKLRHQRDALSSELQEQRVQWARLTQSLQDLDISLSQNAPQRQEIETEQESLRRALADGIRALDDLEAERQAWLSETDTIRGQQQVAQDILTGLEQLATDKSKAVTHFEQETEAVRNRYAQLHEKVQVRRAHLSLMDEKIEASIGRLGELEMSAEDVDWDAIQPGDRVGVRREVNQVSNALKNFGSVNLGAEEDYERLQERNDFLSTQLKDLSDAQAEIAKAIMEMDEVSSKMLAKTFKEISAQFSELFVRLFRGGKAYLELTDPQNLLSTGVEIIAQPPGKRLQNLGLLSSGERAITAIAFLLATLKVRPSPFVVLDELDAPLDDANVERVAQLLEEFSVQSQFLIITHNRKTMEYAKVLYGVTMVEPGSAEVVAVSLEESARHVEQASAA